MPSTTKRFIKAIGFIISRAQVSSKTIQFINCVPISVSLFETSGVPYNYFVVPPWTHLDNKILFQIENPLIANKQLDIITTQNKLNASNYFLCFL